MENISMSIEIKIIYPDIYNKHIQMIKNIQKPFLGKQDIMSKGIVDMCNKQLIKIMEIAIPNSLIVKK